MGHFRLSSFDDVVNTYNNITPIKGARLPQDLRPLAERRYWWRRVAKITDTKYALLDGNSEWYKDFGSEAFEQVAPILWERREDGDYITIRNNIGSSTAISRYNFLSWTLPMGLFFHYPTGGGKHYVAHDGVDHYLPKVKVETDWTTKKFTMLADNKLVFRVNGHLDLTRVNAKQPMQTRRIDKAVDGQYKLKMREMWDWMCVVLPVMGSGLDDATREYADIITGGRSNRWYWDSSIDKNLIREILDDSEHDKRMALAGLCAFRIKAIVDGRFEPNEKLYATFRDCLRKAGGMYAVELC